MKRHFLVYQEDRSLFTLLIEDVFRIVFIPTVKLIMYPTHYIYSFTLQCEDLQSVLSTIFQTESVFHAAIRAKFSPKDPLFPSKKAPYYSLFKVRLYRFVLIEQR